MYFVSNILSSQSLRGNYYMQKPVGIPEWRFQSLINDQTQLLKCLHFSRLMNLRKRKTWSPVSVGLSICLSVSLSVCRSVGQLDCRSVGMLNHHIGQLVCPLVSMSVFSTIGLSVYPPFGLLICRYAGLSV